MQGDARATPRSPDYGGCARRWRLRRRVRCAPNPGYDTTVLTLVPVNCCRNQNIGSIVRCTFEPTVGFNARGVAAEGTVYVWFPAMRLCQSDESFFTAVRDPLAHWHDDVAQASGWSGRDSSAGINVGDAHRANYGHNIRALTLEFIQDVRAYLDATMVCRE